jgi:hypothetical protein
LAPLKLSHVVFSASSPEAVADFRYFAHRALSNSSDDAPSDPAGYLDSGDSRAKVSDLDGNIMEVIYQPPANYPTRYAGSTVRRTQSTSREASRIMEWNYDVARSSPPHSSAGSAAGRPPPVAVTRRHTRFEDEECEPYLVRRSVTTTTFESSPRHNSQGLSAGAVAGLVGAGLAAGAVVGALTYHSMMGDRSRAPVHEYEAPGFRRRSTFPDRLPSEGRPRVVERTIEKIQYPPISSSNRPAPQYVARYSQVGTVKSREMDDMYDTRSRQSSKYSAGGGSSVRTRSETPAHRVPLMITDHEHKSQVSMRHSPVIPKPVTYESVLNGDRASYVSARSHRTQTTVRPIPPPPPPAPLHSELPTRSRSRSRAPSTTIRVKGGSPLPMPPNSSRTATLISAHRVPLPPSEHTRWEEMEDDNDSVAPSDSISCVGSRRSRRSYY